MVAFKCPNHPTQTVICNIGLACDGCPYNPDLKEEGAIESLRDKELVESKKAMENLEEVQKTLRRLESDMLNGRITNSVLKGLKRTGDNPGAILRYFKEYIDELTKETPSIETLDEKIYHLNKWHEEIKRFGFNRG